MMSDGWNIALLGVTGAVGTALLDIMQERQFPFGELFYCPASVASERRCGSTGKVSRSAKQRNSTGRRRSWRFCRRRSGLGAVCR